MKAPEPLEIALLQLTSVDDPSVNETQIFTGLEGIVNQGAARLIVLPENSLFFRLEKGGALRAPTLEDPVFSRLEKFCRAAKCELLLTTPLREGAKISNATIWVSALSPTKVVYRKIHLFDVDVQGAIPVRESADFAPGEQPSVIVIDGWKIGLSICYDLRFAELFLRYALAEVDLLMVPAAFLVPTGKAHWEVLLRARAIECQAYLAAPAQGGSHENKAGARRKTWGHSMVVNPWGEVLAEVDSVDKAPMILRLSLDPTKVGQVRGQIPMRSHRSLR